MTEVLTVEQWSRTTSWCRMITKRRLTLARSFSLGTVALLLLLVLLLSKNHPLDLRALNPVYILPRLLQSNRPLSASTSEKILSKQKIGPPKKCHLYTLPGKRRSRGEEPRAECQRVLPVPGSCEVADTLFHSSPPVQCDNQSSVEYCSLRNTNTGHIVQCSGRQCTLNLLGAAVDDKTGSLQWKRFQSAQALEKWVNGLLRPSSERRKHSGFCLIGCGDRRINTDDDLFDLQDDLYIVPSGCVQILLLPPETISKQTSHLPSSSDINFNVIFIDSVSRQHFFRSLPNTVQLFEGLRKNNGSGVSVFDFELVQAIRSRTFETLQVLFSGEVDPSVKPFGVLEIPPEPLKTEVLLKTLKRRGYSTLWLEDLCYLWEWGLSKDLRVHNKSLNQQETWEKLQQALRLAGIDSLEVTYAMCKVLNKNGVADHFHGPDAVCMNGRHQHEYLLDYLELYQHTMVQTSTPFFTFLETNVGHEDSGRRIQTFDQFFQRYLKNSLKLQNTLTIIFSDHGNSYGAFLEKSMEGRMELFHPHLFLLVPDSVGRILGPDAMKALHINQHRLVSHLDLYYTLQSLAHNYQNRVAKEHSQYDVSSKGLLSVISVNRSCDQIPRIMPNLCICQNFDMPVDSDSYYALFAHMALGKINYAIQVQFLQQTAETGRQHTRGFGHCHRLVLGDFSNIRKSFSSTLISLKMDLLVPSRNHLDHLEQDWDDPTSPSQQEMFFVSMVLQLSHNNASSPSVILERLDRITPYSKFSVCADPTVKLELCVCDVNGTRELTRDVKRNSGGEYTLYLRNEVFVAEGTQECLQLIVKKNEHGGVFSVANVCLGMMFHVVFSLETSGMIVSDAMPQEKNVYPGQELFLGMAVKNAPKADWDWSFTLHHQQESL